VTHAGASDETLEKVEVYCDGSCLGNPGRGGWAALLVMHREGARLEKLVAGAQPDTTNNQMELRAAIEGLRALKRPCRVKVHTDSTYVIKGMTEWRFGWEKRGWKNSKKQPVENRALWEELIGVEARHKVTWHWVEGHAGHPENERVDEAARNAAGSLARRA
jgi:ribonuclease HI